MLEILPNIFCVEIPEGAVDYSQVHIYAGEDPICFHGKDGEIIDAFNPPGGGTYSILFASKDAGEEDWKGVIDTYGNGMYYDYSVPFFFGYIRSPTESGLSLLKSKGLDTTKNYLIIKQMD